MTTKPGTNDLQRESAQRASQFLCRPSPHVSLSPPLHEGKQSPDFIIIRAPFYRRGHGGPERGGVSKLTQQREAEQGPPPPAPQVRPHTQSRAAWGSGGCQAVHPSPGARRPRQPPLRRAGPSSRAPVLILAWRPATEALGRGRLKLCGTAVSWHAGWGLRGRQGHKSGDTGRVSLPRVSPASAGHAAPLSSRGSP